MLAVSAGGGCLDIFSLIYHFSSARYRLKYCLKGPLSPKQPTNQPTTRTSFSTEKYDKARRLFASEILETVGFHRHTLKVRYFIENLLISTNIMDMCNNCLFGTIYPYF